MNYQTIVPDRKYAIQQFYYGYAFTTVVILVCTVIHIIMFINEASTKALAILWLCALGCSALIWLLIVPISLWWIRNLTFVISEDRITILKGILTKTEQNIPYRCITDFALKRTLFDRWLGIGSILVQTAAQTNSISGYEGQLEGLGDYHNVMTALKKRLEQFRNSSNALGNTADVVSSMSDTNVMQEMLTELRAIRRTLETKP